MKRLWPVFLVLILALTLTACAKKPSTDGSSTPKPGDTAPSKPVKIGAIMPLSGNGASYGESYRLAQEIAAADLKAKGIDVQFFMEDGKGEVPSSLSAYEKLTKVNKVKVIVNSVSPVVLAVAPMAERDKVINLNAMAASPQIRKAGEYTFANIGGYEQESTAAAELAWKLGFKKAAGYYKSDATGKGGWEVFRDAFKKLGGEIVGEETHEPQATDHRTQLRKLQQSGTPFVYLSTYALEGGHTVKQAAELGYKFQFMGSVSLSEKEFVPVGGQATDGTIYTAWPFDPQNGTDKMKAFGQAYFKKNQAWPTIYAATSYDGIMILTQAIQQVGDDGTAIKDWLLKMPPYEGVTGTWSFDADGMVKITPMFMKMQGGKAIRFTP